MTRKSWRELEAAVEELADTGESATLAEAKFRFIYDDEMPDRDPALVTAGGFEFYIGGAES